MIDYYARKPERYCGPWVDLADFVIPVVVPVPPHTGRSLTQEERAEISFGKRRKKHTKRTRRKIASRLKKKPKTKQHKEAIAKALRGRTCNEGTRMKMALSATARNFRVITIPG